MALLTPQIIAAQAIGLLRREIVLPALVWRDADSDFQGRVGNTVTVRVPARLEARELDRQVGVELDDLTETPVAVVLDKHPYSAVGVTDEDLTLTVESFGEQVLTPQTSAVAEKLESYAAAAMTSSTPDAQVVEVDTSESGDDPVDTLIDVAKELNVRNVPRGQRRLVVGAEIEAWILKAEQLKRADAAGSDSALRDAHIGRIAGFDVYGSNAIAAHEAYAFHRTAFVLANRAPVVPEGATFGTSQVHDGLAMRWLRDYDAHQLQDRSIVSAFAGAKSVEEPTGVSENVANFRVVKLAVEGVS